MKIKIVEFTELFLEFSWEWLNDPDIKFLTDTPYFSKEDQISWYRSLNDKADYLIWGLMINDTPSGACGLKNITKKDCEYWGYIGNKNYWGKGYGFEMLNLMECKARELNLDSIWLKVIHENLRAIKLYEKSDFVVVEKNEKNFVMKKQLNHFHFSKPVLNENPLS